MTTDSATPAPHPQRVVIETGCRLHFGLLSVGRSTGRQFGGAGVMLDSPGYTISFELSDHDQLFVPPELQSRVADSLRRLRESAPTSANQRLRIEILEEVPRHAGLGSGTQLGMAIAKGWNLVSGAAPLPAVELARRVGRGLRSAIGVHGFEHGGFLIEAGKLGDEISPLTYRCDFPADWRFVLITPPHAAGLSGSDEVQGFAELPPMPEATTAMLWQILNESLRPAIARQDFAATSEALYEYGRIVGEYFSPVQGDVYASPAMVQLADRLRSEDIRGIGQTSWGPTLFVLCPSELTAKELTSWLGTIPECQECSVSIATPRNHGAEMQFD